MPKLPVIKPKELVRLLHKLDYLEVRQTGSHKHFKKHNSGNLVTVPFHNKDIKQTTLISIIKQLNLTIEEFINLI